MSHTITLTLPYPPSANVYWRSGKHGVYVSEEAKEYKRQVSQMGIINRAFPLAGPVAIEVHVYRPRKTGDIMNREKVLSDALQGVAFHDDKQIIEAHFYRHDDKGNGRVEVTITQRTETA